MKTFESVEQRKAHSMVYFMVTVILATLTVIVFRLFGDFNQEDVFIISFLVFFLRDRDFRKSLFGVALILAVIFAIGAVLRGLWLLGS
jgi:hypothetical protein